MINLLYLHFRFKSEKEKKIYFKILHIIQLLHPFRTDKNLIRLGNKEGDRGYLVPNCLEGIVACFSPGVGSMSAFEYDCSRLGMKLFLADKSTEKENIALPKNTHYHFTKKFIGSISNEDYITMNDWIQSTGIPSHSDLLLQMDIEGDEYKVLSTTPDDLLKQFRIIVIEFHFLQKLWESSFLDTALLIFKKLLQNHCCVHIHPNNWEVVNKKYGTKIPIVMEFTFLRNDWIACIKISCNTIPSST